MMKRRCLLLSLFFCGTLSQYYLTNNTVVESGPYNVGIRDVLLDSKNNTYFVGPDQTVTYAKFWNNTTPAWDFNTTWSLNSACFSSDESIIYAAGSLNRTSFIVSYYAANGTEINQYLDSTVEFWKIVMCGKDELCVSGRFYSASTETSIMKLQASTFSIMWNRSYSLNMVFPIVDYHKKSNKLFLLGAPQTRDYQFYIAELSVDTGAMLDYATWPNIKCSNTYPVYENGEICRDCPYANEFALKDSAMTDDGIIYTGVARFIMTDPPSCATYLTTIAGKISVYDIHQHLWYYGQQNPYSTWGAAVETDTNGYVHLFRDTNLTGYRQAELVALDAQTGKVFSSIIINDNSSIGQQYAAAFRIRSNVMAVGYNTYLSTQWSASLTNVIFVPAEELKGKDTVIMIIVAVASVGLFAAMIAALVRINKQAKPDETKLPLIQPQKQPVKPVTSLEKLLKRGKSHEIDYSEISILHELGRGAFGVVFKARWRNTDCVVKQMSSQWSSDEQALKLFQTETQAVQNIRNHPNVCTVYGVCTQPSHPICIVMEFVAGGSLEDLVYYGKIQVNMKIALEFGMNVASGMGHLHRENILHCDLAARNLLVSQQEGKYVLKVSDFGLAKVPEREVYDASKSPTFPIRWSAPETLRGNKVSRASDVWSFGVVMWEILEGKMPYAEKINIEVINAVCDQGYRLPRPQRTAITDELFQLMTRCWATEPKERPTFDCIYLELQAMHSKLCQEVEHHIMVQEPQTQYSRTQYNNKYKTYITHYNDDVQLMQ